MFSISISKLTFFYRGVSGAAFNAQTPVPAGTNNVSEEEEKLAQLRSELEQLVEQDAAIDEYVATVQVNIKQLLDANKNLGMFHGS